MSKDRTNEPSVSEWIDQQAITHAPVDLSVIIPAYNEEWRLPPTLIDIVDYLDQLPLHYEIVVVDDGSKDSTATVVHKFERVRKQIRLIRLPKNCGKGYAVRTGAMNAKGALILFADADGATPFAEFHRLDEALKKGADIAIGSRALSSQETKVETSFHRKYLGRAFNLCINWILLPGFADTQCGFKLFKRNAAMFLFGQQRSSGFSFDVELLYMAKLAGLKIDEVPINWHNVPGSKVRLIVDAMRMFRDVIRFRIMHRSVSPDSYASFVSAS